MKVAIVSDFHIGYDRFIDDAYIQAREALERASEEADMIIIPGDIFDMRAPSPEIIAQGMNLFRHLIEKEWQARVTEYTGPRRIFTKLPIIAIPGTHERRAQNAENAVELLALAGFLINCSEGRVVVSKGDDKVAVCALGGVAEERVKETIPAIPGPIEGAFNIFMFHQSTYELLPFSDDFITYEDLPEGFDLYVDGHIHNRVEATVHGKPFLIPGSTVLTQLKDAEQAPKGFFVYDTKAGSRKFHEIKSRKFVVARIDVTGKTPDSVRAEAEKSISSIISESGGSKPIIRIVFSGSVSDPLKQLNTGMQETVKRYESSAIIDAGRVSSSVEEIHEHAKEMRKELLDNASIKDLGMTLLMEKVVSKGYKLAISPTELFDVLSSETSKEKAVKAAMEMIKSHRFMTDQKET